MKNIFFLLFLIVTFHSFTQNDNVKRDSIIQFINCPAEFPGGSNALLKYISANFDYSALDENEFEFGRIYLSFYIESDGSVTEIDVLNYQKKSILIKGQNPIQEMPKWQPACDENGPIRVPQIIPINIEPNE
jgi:hypothetical protein